MPTHPSVQQQSDAFLAGLHTDVRAGLGATPKSLPPKYFYDARGSALFDEITRLPEYYPTRAETAILLQHSAEIAEVMQCGSLVELGSGTSTKTLLLLRALLDVGCLKRFTPFDVDPAVLSDAVDMLSTNFPSLRVEPVVGDFERDLHTLELTGRSTIAFLGSTIGNLEPAARAQFLQQVADTMRPGDTFLLGTDLVKDVDRLRSAYDDAAGVTAAFNRNVLEVLNRELGADFDVAAFEHVAVWDAENEWIEMRLRSRRDQVVTIADLDLTVVFAADEEMRTEISAKFRRDGLERELAAAGLALTRFWTDPEGDFGLSLSQLRE